MREQKPVELDQRGQSRRKFVRRGIALTGLVAVGVDIPKTIETIGQYFRKPSEMAKPKSVPKQKPIYRADKPEKRAKQVAETMYESAADYLLASDKINKCTDIEELDRVSQKELFDKIGGRVVFGKSNQPEKWEKFATDEAQRLTGLPVSELGGIRAHFGKPEQDTAKYAVLHTQAYAAVIPMSIHRAINLSECGYVAGMGVSALLIPNRTIDNGISDTTHRAVMVDCLEGNHRRNGVGVQWLRQDCMVLDAIISNSSTPFNDSEFASVMPNIAGISQHRLDYPARGDTEVFNIASTKAERFTEILSGRLMLPGDDGFDSPKQAQQELLLRRLYGTFTDIPDDYFEDLTLFRRNYEDKLPTHGAQLAA